MHIVKIATHISGYSKQMHIYQNLNKPHAYRTQPFIIHILNEASYYMWNTIHMFVCGFLYKTLMPFTVLNLRFHDYMKRSYQKFMTSILHILGLTYNENILFFFFLRKSDTKYVNLQIPELIVLIDKLRRVSFVKLKLSH